MRALCITEPHRIKIADLLPQKMNSDDVLIQSKVVGLCKTDLEILQGLIGQDFVTYPVVPGHEWSGVVAQVGEDVKHLKEGDRVISEGLQPCGRCEQCRRGDTNLCVHYDQLGFTRYGGGAEYVVAPAKGVHRIPDALSFEAAVLVEPAACVIRGIMRAPMEPGKTVAVIGPGTLGLIAVQLFRAYGAGRIILIGTRDEQLEFGLSMGATDTVNIHKQDATVLVKALTASGGADIVMETAGSTSAVKMSLDICRSGGHVILEGVAGEGQMLTIPSDEMLLRDLTLHGIFSYTTQAWNKVLGLLACGSIDLEPIVTHRYALDQYEQAFAQLQQRSGKVGKVVLVHEGVDES